MLIGLLRVTAVALATGGAATGLYFGISTTQTNEPDVMNEEAAASTATATSVPERDAAPGWSTYTSPEGFTVDYPADWQVVVFPGASDVPPGVVSSDSVWIMNPVFAEARSQALEANEGLATEFEPPPRSAKIEISVLGFSRPFETDESPFETERLVDVCEKKVSPPPQVDTQARGVPTVVSDEAAVVCEAPHPSLGQRNIPLMEWIELPEERTLRLSVRLVEPTIDLVEEAERILTAVDVGAAP